MGEMCNQNVALTARAAVPLSLASDSTRNNQ